MTELPLADWNTWQASGFEMIPWAEGATMSSSRNKVLERWESRHPGLQAINDRR